MLLLFALPLLKLLFVVALVVVFVALLPHGQPERLRAHLDYDAPEVRPSRFGEDLRISDSTVPPFPPRLLPLVYGGEPLRGDDDASRLWLNYVRDLGES